MGLLRLGTIGGRGRPARRIGASRASVEEGSRRLGIAATASGNHGQLMAGAYPGHGDPSIARRQLGALLGAGVRSFASLMEEEPRGAPDYRPLLQELADERGLRVRRAIFGADDAVTLRRGRHSEVVVARLQQIQLLSRDLHDFGLSGVQRAGSGGEVGVESEDAAHGQVKGVSGVAVVSYCDIPRRWSARINWTGGVRDVHGNASRAYV